MDMDMLSTLFIVAIVLAVCMPFILLVVSWMLRKRNTLNPTPIDVHEMILHKSKKAGKRNFRGSRVKWLYCTGDNDHPGFRYGRMYGLINSSDCVMSLVYNGRKHFSRVSMALHPIEITGDVLSANLTVNCRGFRFKANYLIPVWPNEVLNPETGEYKKVTKQMREKWEKIIDEYYTFLVTQEKIEQLHEENVNACIESMNIKARADSIYERDEHMVNASPAQIRKSEEDVSV